MLNFLRKPWGYVLIAIAHCMVVNQVAYQLLPNQMLTQFTWPLGVWTLASMYAFLTTLLLYRLLIKQEPFSKEFKRAASKRYAILAIAQTAIYFIVSHIIYALNPEIAAKLVNTLKFLEIQQVSPVVACLILLMVGALMYPLIYWLNYFYLWLADKITHFFLKSKNA